MLPSEEDNPQFLHIYFMGDSAAELELWWNSLPDLRQDIIHDLQEFLHSHQSLVKIFTNALELMPEDD